MKLTKIAGVTLALLLVASGAAAAMPGNAPADSQAGQAQDNYDGNADEAEDARADDSTESADRSEMSEQASAEERRGPPTDMPAQAPDFVSEIHQLVNQKLEGSIDNLGEQISAVTPDDADEQESDEESVESEDAEEADDEEEDAEDEDAEEETAEEDDEQADSDEESTSEQ